MDKTLPAGALLPFDAVLFHNNLRGNKNLEPYSDIMRAYQITMRAVEGKKGIVREMSHGEQNLKFSWERFIVCS